LLQRDFFALKECFYSANGDISQFKSLVQKKVKRRFGLFGVLSSYIEGANELAVAVEARAKKERDFLKNFKGTTTSGREDIMHAISGDGDDLPKSLGEFEYKAYLLKLDLYKNYSYFRDLSKFPKIKNPWRFWEN